MKTTKMTTMAGTMKTTIGMAYIDGALSPNERKEKHRLALLRLVLFLAVMCYNAYAEEVR